MSTFKPSAYARVFGRALVNHCTQHPYYNDPMYACSADNSDHGHLKLSVTIKNVETSEEESTLEEKNLLHKSGDISKSTDSFVYIPFHEIDTINNVG